jgi:CubicO group peptidase (beta-lactamase class C family)
MINPSSRVGLCVMPAVLLLGALSPAELAVVKKPAAPTGQLGVLDGIVEEAIRDEEIPGAVVLVGHDGQVIYRKAFGARALEPRREDRKSVV